MIPLESSNIRYDRRYPQSIETNVRINSSKPSGLTIKNYIFCLQRTFTCFIRISEQTAITSLYRTERVGFLGTITKSQESDYYYNKSPSINTTIYWDSNIIEYIWLHVSVYLILSHLQANRLQNSSVYWRTFIIIYWYNTKGWII